MYSIFASWCERFLWWRNFFFILSALLLRVSLSLSSRCRSKKGPPFFFDFFSTKVLVVVGFKNQKKKKKITPGDNSFFGLVFKARFVINKSSRFRIARGKVPSRRKKPHTHTRVTTPRKMSFAVSSFVGTRVVAKTNVRASSSSRRASSVQVFAERKLWWVRDVFFLIRKSQAQARERAF